MDLPERASPFFVDRNLDPYPLICSFRSMIRDGIVIEVYRKIHIGFSL